MIADGDSAAVGDHEGEFKGAIEIPDVARPFAGHGDFGRFQVHFSQAFFLHLPI